MKAYEIAEIFRGILATDDAFAGKNLQVGQSAERPVEAFPAIVVDCTTRPIGGSANFLTFELLLTVLSNPEDTDGAAHAALVELVRAKFFGATEADRASVRAEIKALFEAPGKFRMLGRGHDAPADPSTGALDSSRFKTSLVLAASAEVL